MTLQVIGAGLGRTGTASLKVALEQLGFGRCYHMGEVMMNQAAPGLWIRAVDGTPDWERIFDGYRAAVDYPVCAFWRELADYYPDAKIVLSVRDPGHWFESTQQTIFSKESRGLLEDARLHDFLDKTVFRHFGDAIHDRDFMESFFMQHRSEVEQTIPAERLLVYHVKQGWAPLCEFLDVSVPVSEFPHVNTRHDFGRMLDAMRAQQSDAPLQDRIGGLVGDMYADRKND